MDVVLIGFDLDIIDLIDSSPSHTLLGYIDTFDVSKQKGYPHTTYMGTDEIRDALLKKYVEVKLVLGMDNSHIRERVFTLYPAQHFMILKSPTSHVHRSVTIGEGSTIQHGVSVMPCVGIGKGCHLNVNSSIHHESVLGDFSILAPGAIVLGRVRIGKGVYIGSGAIIKENCTIGDRCVIGAGAVIVDDIPEGMTVVGVPGKRLL